MDKRSHDRDRRGRVHEATVMGLDAIHKIVKVEWIDLDNQGRCKEFSLQDIYRLNPKLALVKDSDLMPPPARPAVPVKSRPVPSVAYARVMRGSESSVGNSVVVLKQDPLPQRSDRKALRRRTTWQAGTAY
uniref:Kinesin-like protein KIF2A isoform X2 n=1 Tax=Petromyzon marinus TaxID=7757 RepID=A0AAJ7T7Z7_PETMA|nr:kinesin-like protein KIF2A isoform X2 [Petromyzon marinus]